jgi:ribosomal protein S18 acetylase RimI-like enzyme
MRAPLADAVMATLASGIDEMNRLAEQSPGFIWRLPASEASGKALQVFDSYFVPFEPDRLFYNLSVWESIEDLQDFAYHSAHAQLWRAKENWMLPSERPHLALWWIRAGEYPSVSESAERLRALNSEGPRAYAFDFGSAFPRPREPDRPIHIRQAVTEEQISQARALFQEYADSLKIDLCFQGFAAELASLPGLYAPPRGRLLLGFVGGEAAACVALRPIDATVCEMKRLYVRPAFRGLGLGRLLAKRAIAEGRIAGYSAMRLDTLEEMEQAIRIYKSLGFAARPAYYTTPLTHTVFMELLL